MNCLNNNLPRKHLYVGVANRLTVLRHGSIAVVSWQLCFSGSNSHLYWSGCLDSAPVFSAWSDVHQGVFSACCGSWVFLFKEGFMCSLYCHVLSDNG